MSKLPKQPAILFYPADWRKDLGVQSLDFFDRGVWFEILCLMHESDQRGKLSISARPLLEKSLAKLLGLELSVLQNTLKNLLELGVISIDEEGYYYNRRMLKDEKARENKTLAGRSGGLAKAKQKSSRTPSKGLAALVNATANVNEDLELELIEITEGVYVESKKENESLEEGFRKQCAFYKIESTRALYKKFLEDFQRRKKDSPRYSGRQLSDLRCIQKWGFKAFFDDEVEARIKAKRLEKANSNGFASPPPPIVKRAQNKVFKASDITKSGIKNEVSKIIGSVGK